MKLSRGQQATMAFYLWEYQYRGYRLYDIPVHLAPPYQVFRLELAQNDHVDDGKVPSLFNKMQKFLSGSINPTEEELITYDTSEPKYLSVDDVPELSALSLHLTNRAQAHTEDAIALIESLAFARNPISFEIHANSNTISIIMVGSVDDYELLYTQMHAHFPSGIITPIDPMELGFDTNHDIAIADFGLHEEFIRPINTDSSNHTDTLTSFFGFLEHLKPDDHVILQVLFQSYHRPIARDMLVAVSDGRGGSFFQDAPEMLNCARTKTSAPLYATVVRLATQGISNERSSHLMELLSGSMVTATRSSYNQLIPLSNEGYPYEFHFNNLYRRISNRCGFILNSHELSSLIHYPNQTIISTKFGDLRNKTKAVPTEYTISGCSIGHNVHHGATVDVCIPHEARLKHTHIIGATGTGKSTLLATMVLDDINQGNGCMVLDPHGDLIDDILIHLPRERLDDIVLIDPSDTEYPIGFNLLQADHELQKIALSSDIVSAFKRYATSWGDNMTAVLANAVNTFLESTQTGTLFDLKRFLVEKPFRNEFLQSVDDPTLRYYWEHEYPTMRKGITPLLTRIDTFLRPKVVRNMLVQTSGVDFTTLIAKNKVVLVKLSQGLIGSDNSYLLGSLVLTKVYQAILGRQSIAKENRSPYYLYLDEFQHFITPNIQTMLSGVRKYGLGLILAHQDLNQIQDPQLTSSLLTNAYLRICFRLGNQDAQRFASGFSFFDADDLENLSTGSAIVRVGSSSNDFNLHTTMLDPLLQQAQFKDVVIQQSRNSYAQDKIAVEYMVQQRYSKPAKSDNEEVPHSITKTPEPEKQSTTTPTQVDEPLPQNNRAKQQQAYIKQANEQEQLRKHRSLQVQIQSLAQQRGYRVHLEEELPSGGRVDVGLAHGTIRIGIEISVANSPEYEAHNIQKCIDDGFTLIYMVADDINHLKTIQKNTQSLIPKNKRSSIFYLQPHEIVEYLEAPLKNEDKELPKRVKGWRVEVNYHPDDIEKVNPSNVLNKIKKAIKKLKQ